MVKNKYCKKHIHMCGQVEEAVDDAADGKLWW